MDRDDTDETSSAASTCCGRATYSTIGSVPETISRNPRSSILDLSFGVSLVEAAEDVFHELIDDRGRRCRMLFQHESIRKSKMLFKYDRTPDIVYDGQGWGQGVRRSASNSLTGKVRQPLSY